jgi:mannose/fructose/N-acetylgalactosamine-specific phosphotransferase system component IIB
MFVIWLGNFVQDQQTNTIIDVSEELATVYNTLQQEEVKIRIIRIGENTTTLKEINLEEVSYRNKKTSYQLEVNLAESDISLRKFNELLSYWGVDAVE